MFLHVFLRWFKNTMKKVDMFGRKTQLTMNKESSYTTICGGFLTTVMGILSLLLFFNFGADMIYLRNPTVISSEIYIDYPTTTYYSRQNNFFMFGVEATNFTHFIDDTIYTANVTHIKFTENENDSFSRSVTIERCSNQSLPTTPNLYSYFFNAPKVPVQNMFCIKDLENYYIEGAFDSDAYIYLVININACQNETRDPSLPPCKSPEVIKASTEGFFALYTVDYLIDPLDYEHPGHPVGKDYFSPLSLGIMRYTNRFISTAQIQTDDGYLFSNSQISHEYPTYSYDKESLLLDNENTGLLMQFILRKDHTSILFNRSYKKFQDVLAEIGGFIQIIYIFFFCLSYPFIAKKYYEKIINLIYNFEGGEETKLLNKVSVMEKSLKNTALNHQFSFSLNSSQNKSVKINDSSNKKELEKSRDTFMKYVMKIKNKPPLKGSYWEFISRMFFPFLTSKGTKIKRLKTGEKLIKEKLDIGYILNKFYEIDKLKMVLFNPNQYHLFEYLPKPTILKNLKIDLGNSKNGKFRSYESNVIARAKKMYTAYRSIKSQVNLTPLDQKLIDLLDDNLREILENQQEQMKESKMIFQKKTINAFMADK